VGERKTEQNTKNFLTISAKNETSVYFMIERKIRMVCDHENEFLTLYFCFWGPYYFVDFLLLVYFLGETVLFLNKNLKQLKSGPRKKSLTSFSANQRLQGYCLPKHPRVKNIVILSD
jgi:hypothetical protein